MTTPMTEPGPSRVSTSTTVTDSTDIDPCPYCGITSGVQRITGTSPRVQAWSCTACQTKWAITTVNPQLYLDRLAATVEQLCATRSLLRQVLTLAEDAATLPDKELRDRLLALADRSRWRSPSQAQGYARQDRFLDLGVASRGRRR